MKNLLACGLVLASTFASACPGGMVKIESLSKEKALEDLKKFQDIPNNKIYVHIAKSLYFIPQCEQVGIVDGNVNSFIDKSFSSEQEYGYTDIGYSDGYDSGYEDGYDDSLYDASGYVGNDYEEMPVDPCNPYNFDYYSHNQTSYGTFLMGKNLISDKTFTFVKNHLLEITNVSIEESDESVYQEGELYGYQGISSLILETKKHALLKGLKIDAKADYYNGERFYSNSVIEICSEKDLGQEEKDYGYVFR